MAAQRRILSDLRLELSIYRILLLTPFEILRNQQLSTTWKVRLYMCLMLIVYITLRVTYCLEFENSVATDRYLYKNGMLWMFVNFFDFVFSSLSLVGIVLNGLITSSHQIEFFQELQHIDEIIMATFGVSIKRSRIRTANKCLMVASVTYYIVYFFGSWTLLGTTILTPYQHFAYFFTYYLDNILSIMIALYYVTCTELCRERLAIVRILLRKYRNFSVEQLETVLQLYVGIRSQILLINRFMGFVVLLKIAHDFTLGSSIVYKIFSSLSNDKIFIEFLRSLKWFCQTVSGTILMIMSAEMLLREVNEWRQILTSLGTDEIRISKHEGVYSILRLIRHRSPVLNACGLFDIDLRLLFAIIGGIITYMIVLLQLQEYDDNQSMQSLDISWA